MRIIGGEHRGRKIIRPEFQTVRPTKDRIREAVFNMISEKVPGSTVLDLFAGSGAYGLEALSRGAKKAVFIEKDGRCSEAIRENLSMLGLEDRAEIITNDVFEATNIFINNKERFDLIFSDPPYCENMAKKALILIYHYDILIHSGLFISEHHISEDMPEREDNVTVFKQKTYKDTAISIYRKE